MKKTSKNVVMDCSGNFSNPTSTGTGAGLASVAMAFDAVTIKAIESGAGAGADTVKDDYAYANAKAALFNNYLMGLGCPSFFQDNQWDDCMLDGIQKAVLDVQLWRRGLHVVRDCETGEDRIEPDTKAHKRKRGGVIWAGLRRGLGLRGAVCESRWAENATAFEDWRCMFNEGGNEGSESTEERTARRLSMLDAVLTAYVHAPIDAVPRYHAGIIARRQKFADKLRAWVVSVLAHGNAVQAAKAAGFNARSRVNPLQALCSALKGAGFKVANGNWRKRLHPGPKAK